MRKITINTLLDFSIFKNINDGTPGKVVSSACYGEQQVCVY